MNNMYFNVALVILTYFTLIFILAQVLKNNSIVDSFWGPGFLVVALFTFLTTSSRGLRGTMVTFLVAVWAIRLFYHITLRNWNKPEDYRYINMRKKWGTQFPMLKAYIYVFVFQGVMLFLISLTITSANTNPNQTPGIVAYIGALIWVIGFYFESVGDRQLKEFKAKPENKGKIMTEGLWSYTRHPNYFGDACVWWGLYLIAAETPLGLWALPGPILLTWTLMKWSGAPTLEHRLKKTRPEYADYIARTSGFVPWPPKKS